MSRTFDSSPTRRGLRYITHDTADFDSLHTKLRRFTHHTSIVYNPPSPELDEITAACRCHPLRNTYLTQIFNTPASPTRLWITTQGPLLFLPLFNPTLHCAPLGQ